MIDVRPVPEADVEAVHRMRNDRIGDLALETVREWYRENPELFVGAYDEGDLVGFCMGHERGEGEVEVDSIAVVESRLRRGIGTALLSAFEERVRALGYERVSLGSAGGYVDEFYKPVAVHVPRMAIDVVDFDHVAIRVSDLDRALGFYRDLLGMPVRDRERYDAGEVPYVAVVAGGRHVHLVPTDEPFDVGGEHLCLLVRSNEVDSREELDALLDDLRERGIEVEEGEPRKRYGAYGRAWAAYVRDPDGRRVELKMH